MSVQQRSFQPVLSFRHAARVLGTLLLAALLLLLLIVFLAARFPINHSSSMPQGIYQLVARRIERGSIVGACVPEEYAELARQRGYLAFGFCPSSVRPVMKYVAAIPGDSVEVLPDGVVVNGSKIANSRALRADSLGRELPRQLGKHAVKPGEYWLISNHDPGSFDSRYFGPVREILGVVEPLLIEASPAQSNLDTDYQKLGGKSHE